MAKPTIGQLLATKGKRQLTMTNAADYNTARAAQEAGIDIFWLAASPPRIRSDPCSTKWSLAPHNR